MASPTSTSAATSTSQAVAAPPPRVAAGDELSVMAVVESLLSELAEGPQDTAGESAGLPLWVRRMGKLLPGGFDAVLVEPGEGDLCALAAGGRVVAVEPVEVLEVVEVDGGPRAADASAAGAGRAMLAVSGPADSTVQTAALARSMALALGRLLELQRRERRLWQEARTDELTGLANIRHFREFLAEKLAWSDAEGLPITLLLFDIDDFKQYNEQYGHAAGDRILRQTACLLKQCCRSHDLVARLSGGGDEFGVIFWDKGGTRLPRPAGSTVVTVASPLQVFERFRARLASEAFPDLGPTRLGRLTISAGMAVYPTDARDVESLLRKADEAMMFQAKRTGKNRIHIVGPDDHPL